MNLKELMKTTPETLAATQRKALLDHVKVVLKDFYEALEAGDFAAARSALFDSPSRDGHGRDDACIDFAYDGEGPFGAGDVVCALERLAAIVPGASKSKGRKP